MIAPARQLPVDVPIDLPPVSDAAIEVVAALLLDVIDQDDEQLAEGDGQGGELR